MSEPSIDELRWLTRIKELEWRAELARLVLAGDTRALSERLAQGPGAAPGDPQLQRELAKLYGAFPSFATTTDDAFAGYLDELERLCNAATPGPWTLDEADWQITGPDGELICDIADVAADLARADAAFIAAARLALPRLIAKVRELFEDRCAP